MSYAIAHVVYGIDCTRRNEKVIFIQEYLDEHEEYCIDDICNLKFYSASGPEPRAIGVEIGRFDECNNCPARDIQSLFVVNPEHIQSFNRVWEKLPEDFRLAMDDNFGEIGLVIDTRIIWGSA